MRTNSKSWLALILGIGSLVATSCEFQGMDESSSYLADLMVQSKWIVEEITLREQPTLNIQVENNGTLFTINEGMHNSPCSSENYTLTHRKYELLSMEYDFKSDGSCSFQISFNEIITNWNTATCSATVIVDTKNKQENSSEMGQTILWKLSNNELVLTVKENSSTEVVPYNLQYIELNGSQFIELSYQGSNAQYPITFLKLRRG